MNMVGVHIICLAQRWGAPQQAFAGRAAFAVGEKGGGDPVEMYLNDIFTVTVNMAGLPGLAVPAETAVAALAATPARRA